MKKIVRNKVALRSCPFCGGTAHMAYDKYVGCNSCKIFTTGTEDIKEIIKTWNTRNK